MPLGGYRGAETKIKRQTKWWLKLTVYRKIGKTRETSPNSFDCFVPRAAAKQYTNKIQWKRTEASFQRTDRASAAVVHLWSSIFSVELTAADSVPTASIDISTDNDQLPVLPTPLLRRRSDEKTELSPVTARQRSWSTRRFARFRSLKTAYNKVKYNTRKSRRLVYLKFASPIQSLLWIIFTQLRIATDIMITH